MTRLEKLKSLCAAAEKGGRIVIMRHELKALLALVEQQNKALEGINIWVAMHNALTAFAAWNEKDVK